MFRHLLLVLAFLAVPGIASPATILVFGDSLSAGYGLPQERSWVSLLENRLREERFNYQIANVSVSGETTTGGAGRIASALKAHRPEIVIIGLGANDGLRGQSLETMRRNLETMIDASQRAKTRVLLVGMRLPPNYGMAYTDKFHQVYGDLARLKKTGLVPFLFEGFAEDGHFFQSDRVHPNGEAQALMLETVWKGLKPLLRR